MAEVDAFVPLVRDGGPNQSPGRGALDAIKVAAAADCELAEHRPVAITGFTLSRSHREHALAEMVYRALPREDDLIGLVVRAVGYGAARDLVGYGEMRFQPGGQQVGAVRHRRPCGAALDV